MIDRPNTDAANKSQVRSSHLLNRVSIHNRGNYLRQLWQKLFIFSHVSCKQGGLKRRMMVSYRGFAFSNITGFTSDLLKHDAASTPLITVQHTIKILDLRFGDGVHTHCCHSHELKKL